MSRVIWIDVWSHLRCAWTAGPAVHAECLTSGREMPDGPSGSTAHKQVWERPGAGDRMRQHGEFGCLLLPN